MNISTSNLINSIGLICDIIGALAIWKYGLPKQISSSGAVNIICEGTNEKEIEKAKRYDAFALCGILLLAGGFVLQLVSNFL